jgi:hypothetical protein
VGGSLDILKPEGGKFVISINLGGRLDICRNYYKNMEGSSVIIKDMEVIQ